MSSLFTAISYRLSANLRPLEQRELSDAIDKFNKKFEQKGVFKKRISTYEVNRLLKLTNRAIENGSLASISEEKKMNLRENLKVIIESEMKDSKTTSTFKSVFYKAIHLSKKTHEMHVLENAELSNRLSQELGEIHSISVCYKLDKPIQKMKEDMEKLRLKKFEINKFQSIKQDYDQLKELLPNDMKAKMQVPGVMTQEDKTKIRSILLSKLNETNKEIDNSIRENNSRLNSINSRLDSFFEFHEKVASSAAGAPTRAHNELIASVHEIASTLNADTFKNMPHGGVIDCEIRGNTVPAHVVKSDEKLKHVFVEIPNSCFARGGNNFVGLAYDLVGGEVLVMRKTVNETGFFEESGIKGDQLVTERIHSPNVLSSYYVTVEDSQDNILDLPVSNGYGVAFAPFIQGEDLADWLPKQEKGIDIHTAAAIGLGCARGLEAYHENDLCHYDFKTENVRIDRTQLSKEGRIVPDAIKVFDNDTVQDLSALKEPTANHGEVIKSCIKCPGTDHLMPKQEEALSHFNSAKGDALENLAKSEEIKNLSGGNIKKFLQERDVYAFSLEMVQIFSGCNQEQIKEKVAHFEDFRAECFEKCPVDKKESLNNILELMQSGFADDNSGKRPTMKEFVDGLTALYEPRS